MKKIILTILFSLLLINSTSCTQIKSSFDPAKIATYSTEISLVVKYSTKLILKTENLPKDDLIQIKYYLTLAKQTINLNKEVVFADINALIDNKISDQKMKLIVEFILGSIERYVGSYDLKLGPKDENVRKITLAALDGGINAVDELLNAT